jgi:hypothetical protein
MVKVEMQYGVNNMKITKLVDLVKYFREGGDFEEFCRKHSLDLESEAIEIYMKDKLSIDSELAYFEFEKTQGKVNYYIDGIKYVGFFDFYFFQEMIEVSNIGEYKNLSHLDLAKRIVSYAINDA